MKKVANILILVCIAMSAFAQINLEVEGKAKIAVMEEDLTADSVVVRQADGTLALRGVSTLHTGSSASPWCLGQDTLGGIVYYIYKGSDGQDHGLIVSYTETIAKWQNVATITNGVRTWDGDYNTDLMTDSPAKDWIAANFTSEWYLPSLDELSLLWHNRFHVNKALFEGMHTELSTLTLYWSSTEYDNVYGWYINFVFGGAASFEKTGDRSVRAVRAF